MPANRRTKKVTILSLLLLAFFIGACSGSGAGQSGEGRLKLAPMNDLPQEVQNAPVTVQQAYQFAVANPEVLSQVPCYCGCGGMGHESNYACYVQGVSENGEIIFDGHALGCSICVDITLDTMRLLEKGESLPDIQAYIDEAYARFGPSNMP